MRFRTTLVLHGRTATGIEVPAEVMTALGTGKRLPVRVTINGFTYRGTTAIMGGQCLIGVSAENRAKAGIAAGDLVDVDLELDDQPRTVTVPPDLAAALKVEPAVQDRFDGLSYSHQKEHVSAIEGAKTPETRQRRIAKAVAMLKEGRR